MNKIYYDKYKKYNIKYLNSLNLTGGSNSKYYPYPYLYEGGYGERSYQ